MRAKLLISLIIGGVCMSMMQIIAYAAPLNFSTGESISISSPATTLTIATSSVADILQVNATSVLVTMSFSTGGTFTLLSPAYDLTISSSSAGGAVTTSCTSGVVSTTISQATGSTTYTITPSGNVCADSGNVAIDSFSANPSSITAGQSSLLSWSVSAASSTSLDNGIGNVTNETSTSVSPSQTTTYTLTATNGSGSSTTAQTTVTVVPLSGGGGGGGSVSVGVASQYATTTVPLATTGLATTTVVTSTSTAALEAQLQTLLALLATLEAEANQRGASTNTPTTSYLFKTTLQSGDSGIGVTHLQEFLAEDPSIYPSGKVTGYFGALTVAAVEHFQMKYHITRAGIFGYGLVGPLTRTKLNSLIEQGITP